MSERILPEIRAVAATLDLEEPGGIQIRSARWQDKELLLDLLVADRESRIESWEIRCSAIRDHALVLGEVSEDLTVPDEHVLLWPHRCDQIELYFNSKPVDALAVVGELYVAHQQMSGDWFPLDRFVNMPQGNLVKLLELGYGMLAAGPVPVVGTYREIMERQHVAHSVLPRGPAKWWNGQKWVEEHDVSVLIIGRSFVVASGFSEQRV